MKVKLIIERRADGLVAYPIGLRGVVIGQGDTFEEALEDVRSAIDFHVESFGTEVFVSDNPVIDAYMSELREATSQ